MKQDLYTKTILTIIALLLTALTFGTVVNPPIAANAQASDRFAGIQFYFDSQGFTAFQPSTGNFWVYELEKKALGPHQVQPNGSNPRTTYLEATWSGRVATLGDGRMPAFYSGPDETEKKTPSR